MLTIIIVILLFASLVIVHEYGHFIFARRNGVKVEEFGFGFPPKVYGRVRNGVLYSINLLPLGGFVRMKGEDASDRSKGSFGAASLGAKARILLAGVGMNLLSAFVLFYILCLTGIPGLGNQFEPSFIHSTYAQPKQILLAQVEAGSPAAHAGLKRGDYVLMLNEQAVTSDAQLRNLTHKDAGKTVTLLVKEGSVKRQLAVKLRGPAATNGNLGVDTQQVYKLRYDPLRAVIAAAYITGSLLIATFVGVYQLIIGLPSLITGLFGHGVPAAAQSASGPVGIIFILTSLSSLGWAYIILFMANISVALGAFNVLPLPALDGGRLFVAVMQKISHKGWKPETEAKYHAAGFFALIGLMLIISVYDLRKYF